MTPPSKNYFVCDMKHTIFKKGAVAPRIPIGHITIANKVVTETDNGMRYMMGWSEESVLEYCGKAGWDLHQGNLWW